MNKLLANLVSGLNAVFAVLIVTVCAIAGAVSNEGIGAILGIMLGLFLAALVCGTIAIFISIRDELVSIGKSLNELTKSQK